MRTNLWDGQQDNSRLLNDSFRSDPFNYSLAANDASFIRKLPGNNVDLSKHLEVTLLFQAAEIERLNSVIAGIKIQSKGNVRGQLDRHSYEIQIKQMSQIIEQLKYEKQGLQKYIKQMKTAMDNKQILHSSTSNSTAQNHEIQHKKLASKYERALLELSKMFDDNTNLQAEINELNQKLAMSSQNGNKSYSHPSGNQWEGKQKQWILKEQQWKSKEKQMRQQYEQQSRMQISQLESLHGQNVAEMRTTFTQQMNKYRLKVQEEVQLREQQKREDELRSMRQQLKNLRSQNEDLKIEINRSSHNINQQKRQQQLRQITQQISRDREFRERQEKYSLQISSLREQLMQQSTSHYKQNDSQYIMQLQSLRSNITKLEQDNNNLRQQIMQQVSNSRIKLDQKEREYSRRQRQLVNTIQQLNYQLTKARDKNYSSEDRHEELTIKYSAEKKIIIQKYQQLLQDQKQQIHKKAEKQRELIQKMRQLQQVREQERRWSQAALSQKQNKNIELVRLIESKDQQIEQLRLRSLSDNQNQVVSSLNQVYDKILSLAKTTDLLLKNSQEQSSERFQSTKSSLNQHYQLKQSIQSMSFKLNNLSFDIQQIKSFIKVRNPDQPTYSESYVLQLKQKLEIYQNQLNAQREKSNYDKSILQQLNNQRWNRQQQENKWRTLLANEQSNIGQLLKNVSKLQNMNRELAQNKQQYKARTEQFRKREVQILTRGHQQQIQDLMRQIESKNTELSNKFKITEDELIHQNQIINEQSGHISQLKQQINIKYNEVETLKDMMGKYQTYYEQENYRISEIQQELELMIEGCQRDAEYIHKLELENGQLQALIEAERNQRMQDIMSSRRYIENILQNLSINKNNNNVAQTKLSDSERIDYQFLERKPSRDPLFNETMLDLQKQFERLERTATSLRNDNYTLIRQTYDESMSGHVYRTFVESKLTELNRQIDRLASENLDLKDEICRCRLEMSDQMGNQRMRQENLATMVLLFAEVQSLRFKN